MLGSEWFLTRGGTRLGVRLGVGAAGESEVVETTPSSDGGGSWSEALVPGVVLTRSVGGNQLVVAVSDMVLGPLNALADPEEYGIEHRLRMTVGIRF